MLGRPRIPTISPYTTLFRSIDTGLIDNRPIVTFKDGVAKGTFTITNTGKGALKLSVKPECFDGATVKLDNARDANLDRKSTRLNSSHSQISYAVLCSKKKNS